MLFRIFLQLDLLSTHESQSVVSTKDDSSVFPVSGEEFARICLYRTSGEAGPSDDILPICHWPGITCRENTPWKMEYTVPPRPKVTSLDWILPTLRKVYFEHLANPKKLHTRLLPRKLTFSYMRWCKIQGSIDLQTLPGDLELLGLPFNEISGTIVLDRLPATLRLIDLYTRIGSKSSLVCFVGDGIDPAKLKFYMASRRGEVSALFFNGKKCPGLNIWNEFLSSTRAMEEFNKW